MTEVRDSMGLRRRSTLRYLPLAALVLGLAAFFAFGLGDYLSFEALRDNRGALVAFVEERALLAGALYVAAYLAVIAFSLPGGAVMSLIGGFLFGTVLGSVLSVAGATVGAIALFLAARTALGDSLRARAGGAVERMRKGFQDNAFSYLLFLRLVPVFPFWLVNLVPALVGVSLPVYALATFIGIIPGTVIYVSVGNGLGAVFDARATPDLGLIFDAEILLPLLGLAALALVPVAYQKVRSHKAAR